MEDVAMDQPMLNRVKSLVQPPAKKGLMPYYNSKIEEMEIKIAEKKLNLKRLEAQRNEMNNLVRDLKKELKELKSRHSGKNVAEVCKMMAKDRILIKSRGDEKIIAEVDPKVDQKALVANARVACNKNTHKVERILPSLIDPLVRLMRVENVPDSTYDMVGGCDQQIKEIKEVIELPIKHPEIFEALGIPQPKGVLMYGPPGTGKTLLARAVAHHTKAQFIRVSGGELVQKYIGEGARLVREVFVMARKNPPSLIFIDEIDSIGSRRTEGGKAGGDSEVQRTMLELLNQLDGFESAQQIKIIMATNRIDILDDALMRPGRIDRKIMFPNPNEDARLDILKIHSRKMNLQRGIDLRSIAKKMPGGSGAETKAVCTEAGMFALRERRIHVSQEDFELAVAKVMKKDSDRELALKFRK